MTRRKKPNSILHPDQLFDDAVIATREDQGIDSDCGSILHKDAKEVTNEPLGGPGWVTDAKRKTPPTGSKAR
jgi:hypothetical protein